MLVAVGRLEQNRCVGTESKQQPKPGTIESEFFGDTLSRVSEWVRFADAKAGGVLALIALLLADALDHAGSLWRAYEIDHWLADLSTLSFWLALAAATLTVILVSMALFPRVVPTTSSEAFFGDISRHKSYKDFLAAVSRSRAQDEMAKQVWEISRIATTKFSMLRKAYTSAVVFLVLYVISRLAYLAAS